MPGVYCTTYAAAYNAVDQGTHTQTITLSGDFSGIDEGFTNYAWWEWGLASFTDWAPYDTISGNTGYTFGDYEGGYLSYVVNGAIQGRWTQIPYPARMECDRSYQQRARISDDGGGHSQGSTLYFKTYAADPTIGTPIPQGAQPHQITVYADWIPATYDTTVTVLVQYKRNSDSTWATWGAAGTGTGYTLRDITPAVVTGLDAATLYNFRLWVQRTNTANPTKDYYGNVASLATTALLPIVTTTGSSDVTFTTAVLAGFIDINDGTGVNVFFKWGLNNPPDSDNTTANQPESSDTYFYQGISGLTHSTTYYFRAYATFASPAGSPVYGSVLSFQTPADPLAVAIEEAHVQTLFFDRKYGVLLAGSTLLKFAVRAPASSSSDLFVTTASPFAAGDVKISKDGGAFADTTNLPTQVTASQPGRVLVLTAAELQCDEAHIVIHDAAGTVFRDLDIIVRTHQVLGSVDIDVATGQKANTSAFRARGYGSGHGMSAEGGATGRDIDGILRQHVLHSGTAQTLGVASQIKLMAGASGNDDFYNGALVMLIGGTGAGQARVIVDYTGSSLIAVVDGTWVTNPDNTTEYIIAGVGRPWNVYRGELTAMIADTANYGDKIQLITQRFSFKISQTATVQTLFKADNSTSLGTRSVSDAAGTQIIGKLS